MRNYEKEINKNSRYGPNLSMNSGLKKVHIGSDVWVYGRQKQTKKGLHMVIYGPNRAEYDVYDEDVTNLITEHDSEHFNDWGLCNRDGNRAIQSKVKVHILTSILDSKDNWCFNLEDNPVNGPLKVIYDNGTVKNIEFENLFTNSTGRYKRVIKPIGYRK